MTLASEMYLKMLSFEPTFDGRKSVILRKELKRFVKLFLIHGNAIDQEAWAFPGMRSL